MQQDRDSYLLDEPNPQFNKMYEFEAHFPDCTMLEISIWDYDSIFGDDLIGTTKVDLEDRFFSPDWNALIQKPVETRSLYCPSSELTQG